MQQTKDDLGDLRRRILEYNPKADIALIEKAYHFAKAAHTGQVREDGQQYFMHPLSVADILIGLRAQSATICAALLHDVVEESHTPISKIREQFGPEVANLVEGVTKIDKVHFENKEDYTAENLRKVLLATAKDIRIMLIKLADRLHNMRTLKSLRPDKQQRIAEETLSIYAPIAHKLGMWNIKGELEDLSLRYLEPDIYQMLRLKINEKREEREKKTKEFIRLITKNLKDVGIEADVQGRAKYFYSIYKKMKRKKVDFSEIYDLIAIRIIVKTIPQCYQALGIIHDMYKPIPGKFKDYIATPKANGYQSLHTAVVGSHGKILEVQIRTDQMHQIADDGIAAHWRYKGTERDKLFDKKISWIKQVLDWRSTADDARDFIESFKINLFEKEIVVFTPKGDPIVLPEGATPVDFAYEIHTNIGSYCSKALVNKKLVPLETALKPGDVVEIVTSKSAKPSRQWLKSAVTSKARSKIRGSLNIETDRKKKEDDDEERSDSTALEQIEVTGKQAPVKLSKCCEPRSGDPIVGYYTKDRKITVHKVGCPNIATLDKNMTANVKWLSAKSTTLRTIQINVRDRVGMLADILTVIAGMRLNIEKLMTDTARLERVQVQISLHLSDDTEAAELIKRLKALKDVYSIVEIRP
jgi:GTP diphosphokinase / guanosine-3',5'-bis(diphosphate) 3'-diphosphatase